MATGRELGAEGLVGLLPNYKTKTSFRNIGVYAQATYKLTDQLSFTGGIRYTSDRTRGEGQLVNIRFPQPNVPVYSCAVPQVLGGTSNQIRDDQSRCSRHSSPVRTVGHSACVML